MNIASGLRLDAGLLADAQAVEPYEISRYGTLRTWAQALGMGQAAELLEEPLTEENRRASSYLSALTSVRRLTMCPHFRHWYASKPGWAPNEST